LTNQQTSPNTCPSCKNKGKRVPSITLNSLLRPECVQRVGEGQWFFCASATCDLVYFDAQGQTFSQADLTVRVGIKETSAGQDPRLPRPVCYCFNHTIESIDQEVRQTGQSTALNDIKTKMKDGCWCETKSPQGSCCLGTVSTYVKRALADHGHTTPDSTPTDVPHEDCCAGAGHAGKPKTGNEAADQTTRVGGLWAVAASVVAAVVASACCWLPLVLLTLGVSSAGAGSAFATLRPYLLAFAAVSLGLGFYLAYRKSTCTPGSTCCTRPTRRRLAVLWGSAAFVIAMALFPYYGGTLIYGGATTPANTGPISTASSENTSTYPIKGMTCNACAAGLQAQLVQLPGVASASVSYDPSEARITMQSGKPDDQAIRDAVQAAGFSVAPTDSGPTD
jgi:copper chaperone CopZ